MNKKFTLIELLVVVAILGILASLLLPTLGQARKSAKATSCQSSIKQVGSAIAMFQGDNDGVMVYNYSAAAVYQSNWAKGVDSYLGGDASPDTANGGAFWNTASPTLYDCPSTAIDAEKNCFAIDYGIVSTGSNKSFLGYKVSEVNNSSSAILLADTWKEEATALIGRSGMRGDNEAKYNTVTGLTHDGGFKHNKTRTNYAFVDGHSEMIRWLPRSIFMDRYTQDIDRLGALSTDLRTHPDYRP
ncbi:type II secretion system protein [Lentisphaera profundi]|uniref:Type II secretion system protein n=1 Tax=Lentisphaera profundi TaxID=1658616 RepID=A0ABY7VW46_9BACT|nr:type II secretion system protein [Lentisphaera profundi]WDE98448.1 type II secretion system protein [Lentisphaera profundi]